MVVVDAFAWDFASYEPSTRPKGRQVKAIREPPEAASLCPEGNKEKKAHKRGWKAGARLKSVPERTALKLSVLIQKTPSSTANLAL